MKTWLCRWGKKREGVAGSLGWFVCLLFLVLVRTSSGAAAGPDGPLSPEESLGSFHTEPGLQVELAAAEPLTGDPVAMAFDERGRLFVVENRGYPTGPGAGKPPEGVIAMLEDTDGDGRYDKRTVFADGLTFPNGLMPWRGGWIVTCAPDVLYLKDSDGDGRADVRKVLFTGFSTGGSTQLRVSHPTLSVDNWVYLTSGLTGGKVISPDFPERGPIELKTDFRFRPGTPYYEAAEGRAQFGMSFDDFGHRFICMNRMQVQHVVMPGRYLQRNSALTAGEPVQNVPEELDPEPVRGHGRAAHVFPISRNITTADSHAGTFTSACGVTVYRGTGLPPEYDGNVFSCEPAGNLVHRDIMAPQGSTFKARRVPKPIEFLASTDNWFRPVFLTVGPDGALYVCAMYRKIIDHPDYYPGDLRKHLDFASGKGMGRIYRVVASGKKRNGSKLDLTNKSLTELCDELESPNGWRRDTAHRLLLERNDLAATIDLTRIIKSSAKPEARVHALWLLDAVQGNSPEVMKLALQDPVPGVRENALRLAENYLFKPQPWLEEDLLRLAQDPNARVRFECALIIGDWAASNAIPALAGIAVRDAEDPWTRLAILSGIQSREADFWDQVLLRAPGGKSPSYAQLLFELGRVIGANLQPEKASVMVLKGLRDAQGLSLGCKLAGANGAFEGAASKGPRGDELRHRLLASLQEDNGRKLMPQVYRLLRDTNAPVSERTSAATFVGNIQDPEALVQLRSVINPREPQEMHLAAVRSASRFGNEDAARFLLGDASWRVFMPRTREAVLNAVLSQPTMTGVLLDLLERGNKEVSIVSATQRKLLLDHKNQAIRTRAVALFKNLLNGDRMQIYSDWKPVLRLKPDGIHGRAVFKQHCSACHRLDQEGIPVGPDLFGMRNQLKEVILLHVIVPEYEIVPGFLNYNLELKDGSVDSGMIASENPMTIVLRKSLGEERVIPRADIATLQESRLSLMPQGLEANMSRQDMADLLSYLKGD